MGLIGAGIGLPWGLMDALAVSVVDKDKVGMATGIFNTVRVSADGVAIAVLSALLAFLIQARLGAALPADPRWPWPRTAPRWASWPRRPPCCQARPTCCARDGQAFGVVLRVLAAIAALTAVLIYALLGRREGARRRPGHGLSVRPAREHACRRDRPARSPRGACPPPRLRQIKPGRRGAL